MSIRSLVAGHPKLTALAFWTVNHLPFNNSVRKKGNKISGGLMTRCRIRIRGSNNQIILGSGTWLHKCKLTIKGSKDDDSDDMEVVCVKIGSGWYLLSSYSYGDTTYYRFMVSGIL